VDLLEKWFCPAPQVTLKVASLDLRIGGKYRLLYRFPSGQVVPVVGEYRTIAPPRQLVFTWTWEAPDPDAGVDTLVTIDLHEKDGGTEVVVKHERFPTEEKMRQHQSGWVGTLERLDQLLHFEARSASLET
jgi:uncharacterized protein YndB with AHSA1/START domain